MSLDQTLLMELLSRPTAPFRETSVYSFILSKLIAAQVPHFKDPVGNLIIGVGSAAAYKKLIQTRSKEPVRIFIAHTDHPGFHGKSWSAPGDLEFEWHGGSPTEHLIGSRVWLTERKNPETSLVYGTVAEAELIPNGKGIKRGVVRLGSDTHAAQTKALASFPATELYGGFGFRAPVWKDGELYRTHVADDLIGCFSILSLALSKQNSKKKSSPWLGLLSRAEEVGFIGTIAHLELGWLKNPKRPLLGVSLETSRTLPGADIGKGPVVRLGDRATVFDPGSLRVLMDLAEKTLPGKHQRRVMDGGTCEATAATAYGIPCVGISVPLGNYHNQSFEGGPDAAATHGPAPEFVHHDDIEGMIALCRALLTPALPWATPWVEKKRGFKKQLNQYRKLLSS